MDTVSMAIVGLATLALVSALGVAGLPAAAIILITFVYLD